jgi:hypothetical protein
LDNSDLGETEKYRLSTASSYVGLPQVQMLAGNEVGSLDIDEFIKGVANSNYRTSNSSSADGLPPTSYSDDKFIPTTTSQYDNSFQLATAEEDDALWMNFTSNNGLPNVTSEPNDVGVWSQ